MTNPDTGLPYGLGEFECVVRENRRLHAMCYRLAEHLADAAEVLAKLAVGYKIERRDSAIRDSRFPGMAL